MSDFNQNRRELLSKIAAVTGSAFLLPQVVGCAQNEVASEDQFSSSTPNPLAVPMSRPSNFNAIEYNRTRGLAGAIPVAYHASITGADGPLVHIGKHMAYIAPVDKATIPAGYVPLMMGEFAKGYTRHGATATHWYDWISIRKEGKPASTTITSSYSGWPSVDNVVYGPGLITDAAGVNTIYLARLPNDVVVGDTICIVAHCNIHGEYISFITL